MSIYHITPEEFEKLNKCLSEELGMEYQKLTESRKKQRHSEETKQKMREIALKREAQKRQTVGN